MPTDQESRGIRLRDGCTDESGISGLTLVAEFYLRSRGRASTIPFGRRASDTSKPRTIERGPGRFGALATDPGPGPFRRTRISREPTMKCDSVPDTAEFATLPPDPADPPAPLPPSVRVDIAGLSHAGKVRSNNEDNFLVVRFGRFLETVLTSLPDDHAIPNHQITGYGMAVADGMGGMAAGEVASRLALTLLVNLVLETPDWILTHEEPHVEKVVERAIRRFYQVNRSIIDEARRQPWLAGMGTTLTMACSLGEDLLIAHVGDSPVYLSRDGKLRRLTRDHTVARQIAEHDSIPVEDVPSRYRNILTHAIGIRETGSEPDIHRARLMDGDRLLLCTDGLTDMVDDSTIADELHHAASSREACQALLDRALESGGRDNITVVVASYQIDAGA
jgi:PPM family protein phosphatase